MPMCILMGWEAKAEGEDVRAYNGAFSGYLSIDIYTQWHSLSGEIRRTPHVAGEPS